MDKINNDIKEQRFRFPARDFVGFGRKLSCVVNSHGTWTATQMETAGKNTIVIVRQRGGESVNIELPAGPLYHHPFLVAGGDDKLGVVWNEFENDRWSVKFTTITDEPFALGPIETVFSSSRLCLPPVGIVVNGNITVVWPAVVDDRIMIMLAECQENKWSVAEPISATDADAFRPTVCANDDALYVFWDQYRNKRYEVAGKRLTAAGRQDIQSCGCPGERWFCPDAVSSANGDIFLTWVVMQEVADDLGIADHSAFAMVGRIDGNQLEVLEDRENRDDSRVIADMREGLLAVEISKGYLGLRRNPMLSVDDNARLWCFWEVRVEEESTAVNGNLVGRCFDGKSWSEPCLLDNPGYGYAPVKKFDGIMLPIAFFRFAENRLDIISDCMIDLNQKRPYIIDSSKWNRWHDFNIKPLVKNHRKAVVDGREYSMFWADTHCHSNFSADAEGEPDEIIHYARDIAGLDALCVIDNDFYPNKTLSPAEWQIHQENSRHFTKKGEFVLFPGYEFTYHREDLSPDFNHRCVIYPGPEGELHRRIDRDSDSDYKLPETLKQNRAMTYPHHCTYELIDPELEWNVEVCSSWRVVLEESDFSIRQLQQGKKFGFIGSSDAHRANPGLGGALTGLFAPELTPEALFDAYRNRRIIATQGFAIFIDFRVNGLFIGSEGSVDDSPNITFSIEAPEIIESVSVIRDGEPVYTVTPNESTCDGSFIDHELKAGNHFYFLKVKLVGDPAFNADPAENARRPFAVDSKYPHNLAKARGVFAWTSPIWVSNTQVHSCS